MRACVRVEREGKRERDTRTIQYQRSMIVAITISHVQCQTDGKTLLDTVIVNQDTAVTEIKSDFTEC